VPRSCTIGSPFALLLSWPVGALAGDSGSSRAATPSIRAPADNFGRLCAQTCQRHLGDAPRPACTMCSGSSNPPRGVLNIRFFSRPGGAAAAPILLACLARPARRWRRLAVGSRAVPADGPVTNPVRRMRQREPLSHAGPGTACRKPGRPKGAAALNSARLRLPAPRGPEFGVPSRV